MALYPARMKSLAKRTIGPGLADVTVEEGSLRFHIAGLRRRSVMGRGDDTSLLIPGGVTASSLHLAVGRQSRREQDGHPTIIPDAILPSPFDANGRTRDSILTISVQLAASRFVTIVGSGGVGKTTVAVAVAHDLLEAFAGSVLFVDLGALLDADLAAISRPRCWGCRSSPTTRYPA